MRASTVEWEGIAKNRQEFHCLDACKSKLRQGSPLEDNSEILTKMVTETPKRWWQARKHFTRPRSPLQLLLTVTLGIFLKGSCSQD